MDISIRVHSKNISKEDITLLIQKIREWELTTKRSEIDTFFFETEPQLSQEETLEIFSGIFPPFEHHTNIPLGEIPILRLGMRAVVVDGETVGTVEEIALNIGEADDADMERLTNAQTISLVKMNRG